MLRSCKGCKRLACHVVPHHQIPVLVAHVLPSNLMSDVLTAVLTWEALAVAVAVVSALIALRASRAARQAEARANDANKQAGKATKQAKEAIKQAGEANRQADAATQRANEATAQASEAEKQAANAVRLADGVSKQAKEAAQKADEATQQAGAAVQKVNEVQAGLLELRRRTDKLAARQARHPEARQKTVEQTSKLTCLFKEEWGTNPDTYAVVRNWGPGAALGVQVELRGMLPKPTPATPNPDTSFTLGALNSGESVQLTLNKQNDVPPSLTLSWRHETGEEASLTEYM